MYCYICIIIRMQERGADRMDGQTEKAAVEGTVEEIIFSNRENGYTVCLLSCGGEPVTVVGTLPGVGEGEKLKVSGTWQMP